MFILIHDCPVLHCGGFRSLKLPINILPSPLSSPAEVRLLSDRRSVITAHEQVKQALLDYIANVYPDDTVSPSPWGPRRLWMCSWATTPDRPSLTGGSGGCGSPLFVLI